MSYYSSSEIFNNKSPSVEFNVSYEKRTYISCSEPYGCPTLSTCKQLTVRASWSDLSLGQRQEDHSKSSL